jgi:type I restriction enzyme R subunit
LESDYLVNYKAKVVYYLKDHEDILAIAKLKTNKPLTQGDVAELERILWKEIGTRQDYEKEYGDTPPWRIGAFNCGPLNGSCKRGFFRIFE